MTSTQTLKVGARVQRAGLSLALAGLLGGLLGACSGDSTSKPTLNWYINPDGQETLIQLAAECSTDDYDLAIQLLPASATDQRTQLARRLAAKDSSTDLMSLDPVFVPEFANAGWLSALPDDTLDEDVLKGAAASVTWNDQVYAAPQWANTQVLWFRKSLAQAADLDMDNPVTWEQVIDAAAAQGGTVGVQGNKYEAYVVWINALVQGAGGEIVGNTESGRDARVQIDSEAGAKAAAVIQRLAASEAAQPDLSVSNEGTSLGLMFPAEGAGEFMVNWTFVYKNYLDLVGTDLTEEQFSDLGWARYPQTELGMDSKPPIGGINIGVGAYTDYPEYAAEAAACVTSPEAQTSLAVTEGLMPARGSVYDNEQLGKAYPQDLLDLFRASVDEAGPRPKSAYYSMISAAIQEEWHAPATVDPQTTPEQSAEFLANVLAGRSIL